MSDSVLVNVSVIELTPEVICRSKGQKISTISLAMQKHCFRLTVYHDGTTTPYFCVGEHELRATIADAVLRAHDRASIKWQFQVSRELRDSIVEIVEQEMTERRNSNLRPSLER